MSSISIPSDYGYVAMAAGFIGLVQFTLAGTYSLTTSEYVFNLQPSVIETLFRTCYGSKESVSE